MQGYHKSSLNLIHLISSQSLHLTFPEELLSLDPIYPVLRSCLATAASAGRLEDRLPHLETWIVIVYDGNITDVLHDDAPDNIRPVSRCQDKDEATTSDDDTAKLHASKHDIILSIVHCLLYN